MSKISQMLPNRVLTPLAQACDHLFVNCNFKCSCPWLNFKFKFKHDRQETQAFETK